ncbi:hypothetical protein F5878DRAFT_221108 [Lentinula raphanica]|uniref:Uncharacterized protein n=1 Tax=Lentinula raphanica TaxID=153919 RepID=A0AA38P6P9_9AGAR|nr:hypothetical protein F5878DRAFT_221108 [Lentinula raphanica]
MLLQVWLYSGQMSHGEVVLCCWMWACLRLSTTVQFYPISTSCFVRNLVVFYPLLQQGSQKILVIFTRFLPLEDQASQLVFGGPGAPHVFMISRIAIHFAWGKIKTRNSLKLPLLLIF